MFQSSSRSQSDPIAVSNVAPQNSTWRPTLRMIKRGLFNKDDSLSSKDPPRSGTARKTAPPLDATLQEADAYLLRTNSLVSSGYDPKKAPTFSRSRTTRSRERHKGRRDPLSSGFTFIKQSSSKSRSRRHRPTESQGGLLHDLIDLDQENTPYIPKHAASDFSKSTRQQPQEQKITTASTPTPAYTPTHAASDFSKLKLTHKMVDANATLPQPHSTPSPTEIEDSNNDFQLFLAAARAAAARTYNTTGVISPNKPNPKSCPPVSQKMRELASKQQETARQRAASISQQSVGGTSKPATVLEKVGEYIKPSRTGSVSSRKTGLMDERGSVMEMGGINTLERKGVRRERSTKDVRRSPSNVRKTGDEGGDQRARRKMATNPELKKK